MIFSMHYVTPFVQKRDVEDDLFYIHPIVIIYSTFSDGNLLKMGRRHEKKSYTSHNAYFTSKSGLKARFQFRALLLTNPVLSRESFLLFTYRCMFFCSQAGNSLHTLPIAVIFFASRQVVHCIFYLLLYDFLFISRQSAANFTYCCTIFSS